MDIAPSNDNPWMREAIEGHKVSFELPEQAIDRDTNGGPDKKWSCYRVNFESVFCTEDGCICVDWSTPDELCVDAEVPFWAMKAFEAFIKASKADKEGSVFGHYTRTADGKKNTAAFE